MKLAHTVPPRWPQSNMLHLDPDQTEMNSSVRSPKTYTGRVAAPLTEGSTGLAKQYCCRREIKDS